MGLLGTNLFLLLGPGVPLPARPDIAEVVESIEVTHADGQRSGCQLVLRLGRSMLDAVDYRLALDPTLKPFSRIGMVVLLSGIPKVLFDGVITDQQITPGNAPGEGRMTITGEDMSALLDLVEPASVEHPAQPELVIALKILATYAPYGVIPMVLPPPSVDVPIPTERIPVQQVTDLQYLNDMAARFGYTFHFEPGPAPATSTAYWGPPKRITLPQRAISVNMGPETNASNVQFQYDGNAQELMDGSVQDRNMNTTVPVKTFAGTRMPLAAMPAYAVQPQKRVRALRGPGLTVAQAYAKAQGITDASQDRVLRATGELDTGVYGGMLMPWSTVGLRGVGYHHDGFYYVERVTHRMEPGKYTQSFSLLREGHGAISPFIIP